MTCFCRLSGDEKDLCIRVGGGELNCPGVLEELNKPLSRISSQKGKEQYSVGWCTFNTLTTNKSMSNLRRRIIYIWGMFSLVL